LAGNFPSGMYDITSSALDLNCRYEQRGSRLLCPIMVVVLPYLVTSYCDDVLYKLVLLCWLLLSADGSWTERCMM